MDEFVKESREYVRGVERGEGWCTELVTFISVVTGVAPNVVHRNLYKLAAKKEKA